jgi:Pleckstrin homology domain
MDEASSAWSPSISSTWSKASLGKTLTSMSVDSFGSEGIRGDYQKSIGFANALSQAIIREDSAGVFSNHEEGMKATPLLDHECLELSGAPWAKEGSLKHKQHLDGVDKRAKSRNWNDCFAVIEKGWMRLFSFSVNAKSLRLKAKDRAMAGGVVGGGNWMDSAEEVWKFLLRHTIASALPDPGYSQARPYVWALSLPTGAVHLFHVGTPDIVKEFVSTANYWSARLSKEPMMGGISNMEYGWSDAVVNRALISSESYPTMPVGGCGSRPSIQSSLRSSIDQVNGSMRPKLPGDKITINEWSPPQQSMMASQLMEVDQLRTLHTYVKNVEDELAKHNELRSAVQLAFPMRHPNTAKAMANWEKKSSYLLREIVKFKTYVDSLLLAQKEKEKVLKMKGEDKNKD